MGIVRTIKGEDGKPYISLEDFIKEVEDVKETSASLNMDIKTNFIEIVLTTLHQMESEWYIMYLFRKDDGKTDK
jgi:hypothetical protein